MLSHDFAYRAAMYAALVHLALIIGLAATRRGSAIIRTFILVNLALLVWNAFRFLNLTYDQVFLERISMLGAIFVPPLFLHFLIFFLNDHSQEALKWLKRLYWTSGIAILALPFDIAASAWAQTLATVYILVGLSICMERMWEKRKGTESSSEERDLEILLFWGILVGVLLLTDLVSIRADTIRLGSIAGMVYTLAFGADIVRRRLLSPTEILLRATAPLIFTIVAGVLMIFLWSLAGVQPTVHIGNVLIILFVLLLIYQPIQQLIQNSMEGIFFRRGSDLQHNMMILSRRILSQFNVKGILSLLKEVMERFPKIDVLSVYTRNENSGDYIEYPLAGVGKSLKHMSADREIIKALSNSRQYLIYEDIEREINMSIPHVRREELTRMLEEMRILDAHFVFPFFSGRALSGFFSIRLNPGHASLNSRELAMIQTIANQVAVALENARIYQEIAMKDKMASLGEMAAGLAHEIRSPLAAIKGAAQYLKPGLQPDEVAEFLNVIVEEVDRLNLVVSSFLDFARPLKFKFTPTDANSVIAGVLKRNASLLTEKKIEILLDLDDSVPPVNMDAELFALAWENLISNAVQSMKEGGYMRVESTLKKLDKSEANELIQSGDENLDYVFFTITDSGEGIEPGEISKIFAPFYTTKEKGTGLGLSLVHKIISGHDGASVSAFSTPNQGTRFVIRMKALER